MIQRWVVPVILLGLMVWTPTGLSLVHAQAQPNIGVAQKVAPNSVTITGEYWALIIGIDRYQHAPDLTTAVHDATAVREVLIERYGFGRERIMELLNDQATRTGIEDALYQLGQQAGPDDSVFIYYAGHGQYDDTGKLGWWVPTEANPKRPGTFIMDVSILRYIKGMQAKHVYLVADSCFSGTLFGTRALPPINDQWFAKLYAKTSRWGFTSGGTEPVADLGKAGHSIFAYHFLTVLRENTDPYLVPSRIHDRTAPLVANNALQMPRSEPLRGAGDEGGQFVFRLAATKIASNIPDYLETERQRLTAERARFEAERETFRQQTAERAKLDAERQKLAKERTRFEEQQRKEEAMVVAKAPAFSAPQRMASEITGKDGGSMVLIREGEFWMGSSPSDRVVEECVQNRMKQETCQGWFQPEQPRHRVAVDTFYLDRYEVNNRLFDKFVQATGHRTTAEREGNARAFVEGKGWETVNGASWRQPEGDATVFVSNRREHPVVAVSWEDANTYCRHYGKRLPTEAEWEYAARAGTQTGYWWGNGNPGFRSVANVADESAKRLVNTIMTGYDDGYERTSPVGAYDANPWGLHDMNGNVNEWMADWYGSTYYQQSPERNPQGPSSGTYRVLRGGSWLDQPLFIRSAYRGGNTPTYRGGINGFRCAQDAP